MMSSREEGVMDIFERITNHRTEEHQLAWKGTFSDYIDIVKKTPNVARTAHTRVYDMIVWHGVKEEEGRKVYKFFEDEIFGLDPMIEKLVEEYFHSAARRLEVRKRILLLMGPVS